MTHRYTPEIISTIKTLAQAGETISAIGRVVHLGPAQVNEVIAGLGLERPMDVRRRNRESAIVAKEPSHRAVEAEIRRDEIAERLRNGESVQLIAEEFGVTGEAIHKIRRKLNIPRSGQIKKGKQDQLSASISAWVLSHPGCMIEEIANEFMLAPEDVEKLLIKESKHLVLRENAASHRHALQVRWTQDQTFLALQKAANRLSPLTRENYDSFRTEGMVSGPSGIRIVQIYGKWTSACELAGVTSGEPMRYNYKKNWTREEMTEYVSLFLTSSKATSADSYDEWARKEVGAPSFGTVRNEFESWSNARDEALRLMRFMWED